MKRLLICLVILVPVISLASNEGVGILFDNSGSMIQNFTREMLQDAKDVVLGLIFNGTYDQNTWTMIAESDEYKNRTNKKIWDPGDIIYLHAFGELNRRIEPFFVSDPDYVEFKLANKATEFIRRELYSRLDFSDRRTNFDLAKYLCWWNLSSQLGQGGKNYYMDVLIVSDFLPDPQHAYSGAGDNIKNAFITNNAGETTLFRLVHNQPSKMIAGVKLEVRLLRIGPHYIPPAPTPAAAGTSQASTDRITLVSPQSNYELNPKKESNIRFTWNAEGEFDKYIIEIHSLKPMAKVLIRETKSKQTLIPAKILISKMESYKSDRLVWFVKGVYPENNPGGNVSIISNRYYLKKLEGGSSKIWILFLILALIAAAIFGLPKIIQAIKKAKNQEKKVDRQDWKTDATSADGADDWSKDLK